MLITLAEQCAPVVRQPSLWQGLLQIVGALVAALCFGAAVQWTANRIMGWVDRWRSREPSERSRHAAKVYDEMFGRDD